MEGGGCADWGAVGEYGNDYGCDRSPDAGPDGCGAHMPRRIEREPYADPRDWEARQTRRSSEDYAQATNEEER